MVGSSVNISSGQNLLNLDDDDFDEDYDVVVVVDDGYVRCQRDNETALGGGDGTVWERLQRVKLCETRSQCIT